ncbi:MAG: leucine-rich repeat domain-containing protein [Verrucomicrobia bacterium]|nr:leucine-rich repeat domain-containing protein [Verrucomicrobiota bacterium]
MPITHWTSISTKREDPYRTRDQDAAGQELLKLPPNVLGMIGNYVATGCAPEEVLTNGLLWSRVSVCTHLISHEFGVTQKIQHAQQELEHGLEDDALIKMWGRLSHNINFNGNPPPATLAEIKAWFEDPAHAEGLNALTCLNLSDLQLKAIPPQITQFSQLEQLSLENNQITDISALRGLSQLQILYASNNLITDISVLWQLDQLTEYYFDGNPLAI